MTLHSRTKTRGRNGQRVVYWRLCTSHPVAGTCGGRPRRRVSDLTRHSQAATCANRTARHVPTPRQDARVSPHHLYTINRILAPAHKNNTLAETCIITRAAYMMRHRRRRRATYATYAAYRSDRHAAPATSTSREPATATEIVSMHYVYWICMADVRLTHTTRRRLSEYITE